MHALEQTVADELRRRLAQQLLRRERGEQHAAPFVMTGDHVGRVLGEQPVTLLADADGILGSVMDGLYGDRETRGVDDGAHGAEKAEQIGRDREQRLRWHRPSAPPRRAR